MRGFTPPVTIIGRLGIVSAEGIKNLRKFVHRDSTFRKREGVHAQCPQHSARPSSPEWGNRFAPRYGFLKERLMCRGQRPKLVTLGTALAGVSAAVKRKVYMAKV